METPIPEHLTAGWQAYREWWEARSRTDTPLPPGGVFILNRRAVLLDELFRLHCEAAQGLGVPLDAIHTDLSHDDKGRIVPIIELHPPKDWQAPISGDSPDALIKEYIAGFLGTLYDQMQTRLKQRIASLDKIRLDVQARGNGQD